ncbi:MAG: hypothetical protein AAFR31_07925 [Cyanobacteria bacterium J06627_8]
MFNSSKTHSLSVPSEAGSVPVFAQKALDRCHIVFPDCDQPTSAIVYEQQYYAYTKFFTNSIKAQNTARRLIEKGKKVVLTRVRKGFVLWLYEPEAQRAK